MISCTIMSQGLPFIPKKKINDQLHFIEINLHKIIYMQLCLKSCFKLKVHSKGQQIKCKQISESSRGLKPVSERAIGLQVFYPTKQ